VTSLTLLRVATAVAFASTSIATLSCGSARIAEAQALPPRTEQTTAGDQVDARRAADALVASSLKTERYVLRFADFEFRGDEIWVNYDKVHRPGFEALESPPIATVAYDRSTRRARWVLRE
jgi:hypothetical protein